jgi:predicted exporter
MNRTLTITLALAAGLLGGLLSRQITLPSVHAQAQAKDALEVRAQAFTLVDAQGHAMGTFTLRTEPEISLPLPLTRVVLLDPLGREIWTAGGTKFKSLAENSK